MFTNKAFAGLLFFLIIVVIKKWKIEKRNGLLGFSGKFRMNNMKPCLTYSLQMFVV